MLVVFATIFVLGTVAGNGLAQSISPSTASGNYLVAIRVNKTKELTLNVDWFNCAGSIIDNQFVITAAKCFINDDNEFEKLRFTVLAGTKDLKKRNPEGIEVGVEKVYVPNDYVGGRRDSWSNLAVIKLDKSLDLEGNPNLKKLRLPDRSRSNKIGDRAAITGFGIEWSKSFMIGGKEAYMEDGKMHPGDAEVAVNSKCPAGKGRTLCVRVITAKKCLSDTGGPLVYDSDVLIGVQPRVRYISCYESETPRKYFEYVNVASRIDFIRDAMNDVTTNMRAHEY